MKGFGIEIKNNLLEPKHREAISESIWLYMWFLDKLTKIEDTLGYVLGGRPVKYEEINEDLSISEATYKRWISRLKKGGYINTKRTPYGLIISVNKAFKRFGRSVKDEPSGSVKNELSPYKNELSSSVINDTSKEDNNTLDNNSKTISTNVDTPKTYGNVEINQVIDFLKAKLGVSLDGPAAENRRYAHLLIGKLKKDYPDMPAVENVCHLITAAMQDNFHSKNATNFKYLYYNCQKIVKSFTSNKPLVGKVR